MDIKHAFYGLVAASLAATFCVVAINTLPMALNKISTDGIAVMPSRAVVFVMMTGVMAALIALAVLVPAMCFHFIAEVMTWRHPVAYISAGAITSIALALMTILPGSGAASDRAAVVSIAVSGCISGFIFWTIAVRPLRREALSPKSTG